MNRKIPRLAAGLALCLLLTGCTGGLASGDTLSVTPHQETGDTERATEDLLYANSYDELYDVVMSMAKSRMTSGVIQVNSYVGDLSGDFENICQQITHVDPFGAYAVYYISSTITRIVSYYEINVSITYSKNLSRIQSLGRATSNRYFNSGITDAVKNCESFYAVYTTLDVTPEYVKQYVRDLYYGNPLEVPVLPEMEVSVYPDEVQPGQERIVEVSFTYPVYIPLLQATIPRLSQSVQALTEESGGSSDGEILLSLCRVLCDTVTYTSDSGDAPLFATACYTLDEKLGNGEGYAMVYKALCDKLGLECRVVLGSLNDMPHAWNIVSINGEYYHVDVSMCDEKGEETSFLLRDDDMLGEYRWDTEGQPKCAGSLTYYDIIQPPTETLPSAESTGDTPSEPAQPEQTPTAEGESTTGQEETSTVPEETPAEPDAQPGEGDTEPVEPDAA